MALRIETPELDHLANSLAKYIGESVANAVILALRERLEDIPALVRYAIRNGIVAL